MNDAPGSSRENPIIRTSARILVLDPDDRTLLFTAGTPDTDTGLPFWFPPGGGLEGNETHEEAAARELMEETGLSVPLGPMLWENKWLGEFQETWYHTFAKFFVARCNDPSAITQDNWSELELQTIRECRWWSLAEIEEADHRTGVFVPRQLARLLPPILRGEYPAEPFWVDVDGEA